MTKHDAHMIAEELYRLMQKDNDPLLSSEEAAAYLHMSESHFSHIATRLSRVKAGRRWLYPKSKIIEAITNKII